VCVDADGTPGRSSLAFLLRIDGATRRFSDGGGDVNFLFPMLLVCGLWLIVFVRMVGEWSRHLVSETFSKEEEDEYRGSPS
jgi:hypothetical protein